jgi:ribosomal protein S27AE
MIVCTNCGNHNEDNDEFCGSCGKFLEWVGERIETPVAPAPVVEEAEPDATKAGFVDRVKAAVGIDAPVGVGVGGAGSLPEGPSEEDEATAALEAAAAEAAAAETARLEAEAAEATRRAALAQEEANARVAEQADALRKAEAEAKLRADEEAKAKAEADARRAAQAEADQKAREEAAARAAADAEAARQAEQARLAQIEAERESATAAERAAAEAEAARQAEQAREAQAAADAAKRAEEAAKAAAEIEAKARAEAEAKARAEAEARKVAEEDARLKAEDEARARAAAEQRAREEEEARKRAAALLARPKAPSTPVEPVVPAPDPFVAPAPDDAALAGSATHAMKPMAQQPQAQQPSAIKQPPRPDPKIIAAEQAIKEGDLVCSQCGSGNDPTRKFCRKCGNSLAMAVAAKKLPWWKRFFGGKKVRTSKEAADREKGKQKARDASFKAQMAFVNLRKGVMILAMLGIGGTLIAVPSLRVEGMRMAKDGLGSVQDIFNPQIAPVNAVGVTASSSVPGKDPNLAADLVVNSFWAEGAEGDGVGQTISFTFAEKTDLTKVIITAGSTDTPEAYLNNPRPKQLHVVFDNGGSTDITLIDAEFRKSQGFNLKGAKGVTKVDLSISSVFPGRGGSETGLAEVEFKKKG